MSKYVSVDDNENYLEHYGKGHLDGGHSGRYPWGSGAERYQRALSFLDRAEKFEHEHPKATGEAIYDEFGMTMAQYKQEKALCNYDYKCTLIARARELSASGEKTTEIGKKMGVNESTVRGWLDPQSTKKLDEIKSTVDTLRDALKNQKMVDIGPGVETELGISSDRLATAAHYLETREGYHIYGNRVPQATNRDQKTIQKVLAKPEVEWKETYKFEDIGTVNQYHSEDNGKTFEKFHYPTKLDPNRMMIRYAEEGGIEQDGVIEIRRGLKDLNLNGKNYSQVRILVDGQGDKFDGPGESGREKNYYLKGMCVYADDLPDGVDIRFNTNKHVGTPWKKVLKTAKDDLENPFGSTIAAKGQAWYEDEKTGEKKLGLINKRADEDEWDKWGDSFSGQFLSKQPISLIKRQLGETKKQKQEEYDSIMAIDNPVVRKYFLDKFASDCDSTAVHLRAANIPGSKFHVILPVDCKETECYAPNYPDGTRLALIRYPHAGTFEIPEVVVNNSIPMGKKRIGNGSDAIGINFKTAEQLSGADFDGDTVMAIPTGKNGIHIKTSKPLEGLKDFDPKEKYPYHEGMTLMTESNKGREMGMITNLISDMTLQDPTPDELARAVRHSMVVIDAFKHKLDYKQSEKDNDIRGLKEKYQVSYDAEGKMHVGGTTTIITRASATEQVAKRQGQPRINMPGKEWYDPSKPEGALIYKPAPDATYTKTTVNKRTGEVRETIETRHQDSTKMMETDNAYTLMANQDPRKAHPKELAYADFANDMKALANQARKEYMTTPNLKYDKEAAKTYAEEVASLNAKLAVANANKGKERAAQRAASVAVRDYKNRLIEEAKAADPNVDVKKLLKAHNDDTQKKGTQALTAARADLGAKSRRERNIEITDAEWKAIQAGAISNAKLEQILNNADADILRSKATPKVQKEVKDFQYGKILNMINQKDADGDNKFTTADIAKACGVSLDTIQKIKKGEM